MLRTSVRRASHELGRAVALAALRAEAVWQFPPCVFPVNAGI